MNVKTPLAALATAFLITNPCQVFAASTVDLTVNGLITPSACSPLLSGNGVVDHGKISARDLNADQPTKLNDATLQLNVNCDAQTLFALRGVDNRAGSGSDPQGTGYGLGLINGSQKLGYYYLQLVDPLADGIAVQTLESMDDGTTWHDASDSTWQSTSLAGFGVQSDGVWAPIPIKELSTQLQVLSYISATGNLDLTNEAQIDGSATLEVKYL